MESILILICLVAGAYVVARWVVDRLQRRFLVTTGMEYVLVGVLLGPQLPGWDGVLHEDMLVQVAPIISLAIGWIGLTYGFQANLRDLLQVRDGAVRLAFTGGLITLVTLAICSWMLLDTGLLGDFNDDDAIVGAWVLAAAGVVGSTSVVDLIRRRFQANGPVTRMLARTHDLSEVGAILCFGLIFCAFHDTTDAMPATWNYANWVLVSVGLGVGLGLLFRLFLGDEHDTSKQFLALLGIVTFASGAAYFLQLSLLFVNLILGATLANVAPNANEMQRTLQRYHQPMSILLLIFAGAMWVPVSGALWLFALAYTLLRVASRLGGGTVVAGSHKDDPEDSTAVRSDVGRGLLGHGEVAVAMAISAHMVYNGPVMDLALTAILTSVVLSEIWAARATRRLLIDAGEISADAQHAQPLINGGR